uniref:Uncharacterized protein n=1 Tax=Chenopodium quinoa TaxID=63459 RepID=A0A803NCA6_CHEQI
MFCTFLKSLSAAFGLHSYDQKIMILVKIYGKRERNFLNIKSSSQPSTSQPSSSQPKTKQQSKASSSQPEPTTAQEPNTNFLISSSQPAPTTGQQPTHTGGEHFLDYDTGSGNLSIAALKEYKMVLLKLKELLMNKHQNKKQIIKAAEAPRKLSARDKLLHLSRKRPRVALTSMLLEWAMAELLSHPRVMAAQDE